MFRRTTPLSRRGLSTYELLGCLLAVSGGVWLGASYLGLDLHGAAYQALDENELLTQIPEGWRPANPACPDGDCPDPVEVRAEQRDQLQTQFEALQVETARLTSEEVSMEAIKQAEIPRLTDSDRLTRDRTVEYWKQLSAIVTEVRAIEERVAPFAGSERHTRAMAVRRRALEYGLHAVSLLEDTGVDDDAVATGVRVAEWFGQAADTLESALELRSSQPVGGRAMAASDVWGQIEADLHKRTDLVSRKSRETAAYLAGRYFVDFPPLGL